MKLRNALRKCSKRKKTEAYLEGFELETIERLLTDWDLWAREDQLPPQCPWTTWLKFFGPAVQVLAAIMKLFAGRRQRRLGRLEAENEQLFRDQEMLRKAADARRSVRDDSDGVFDDSRNRDAR